MKTSERTEVITCYTSEVNPEFTTELKQWGEIIEWADQFPVVYKIVGERSHSKAFGMNATVYMGCQRGPTISGALSRLTSFKYELEKGGFFGWRAQFTLEHYGEKGFTSGFFQEFDGKYDRGCTNLDYTPKTREEVLDRFLEWCREGYDYGAVALKIDGKIVRTLKKDVDSVGRE